MTQYSSDSTARAKDANISNTREIEKFAYSAQEWWDKNGPFKLLHQMNLVRIKYIVDAIMALSSSFSKTKKVINILDIGGGGGLVAIPLAKAMRHTQNGLKCDITVLDPNQCNCKVVEDKASELGIHNINTVCSSLEDFAANRGKGSSCDYDVILLIEVLEHVYNRMEFLSAVVGLLSKSRSICITSTMNRTITSYLQSIIAAENILRIVPKNTHDWNNFIKPSEILYAMNNISNSISISNSEKKDNTPFTVQDISGMKYDVFRQKWSMSKNISNNYIMTIGNSNNK